MKIWTLAGILSVIFGFATIGVMTDTSDELRAANTVTAESSVMTQPQDSDYQPVDESMHHFMEYLLEPGYHRLSETMAIESPDNETWKSIKGDSMLLAEAANLLLLRMPEEQPDVWRRHALTVREHGTTLYQAAREKNREQALESYQTMINNCNRCHDSHAEGEYQLDY